MRLLTHMEGPRRVVVALAASLPVVSGIVVLILLLWFPAAVIGVHLFQGLYWTCSRVPYVAEAAELPEGQADCAAHWVRMLPNFDNFFTAIRTAHILSTGEDWTRIMWSSIDRVAPGGARVPDSHLFYGLYFVIFYFFGGLMPMQMVVGAIVDHFNCRDARAMLMTAQQQACAPPPASPFYRPPPPPPGPLDTNAAGVGV